MRGVGSDVSVFAAHRHGAPVAQRDRCVVRARRRRRGAAVLLRAVDPVRVPVVGGHVVELGGRLVVPGAPRFRAVHADDGALVGAEDHAARLGRIDPQRVVVVAARRALDREKRLAPVGRPVQGHVAGVDRVRVLRVHRHPAEVPAALPDPPVRARARPGRTAVGRGVQAALFRVHERVHAARLARGKRDSDSAELLRGKASGDRLPRVAAVDRAVEPAARPVRGRVGVPGRPPRLPERGQDRLRVRGIEGEIDRAGVLVLEEDARPGPASVLRAEDSALRIGAVAVAERRDVHEVRVARIHDDAPDLPRVLEADVGPCPASVRGAVHAVAVRDVRAHVGLARTDVENARVRGRDRERADRRDGLTVEDRLPGASGVPALPHAAADRAEVEVLGLSRHARDREHAPAAERAREAPVHVREQARVEGLGRQSRRRRHQESRQEKVPSRLHQRRPSACWRELYGPCVIASHGRRNRHVVPSRHTRDFSNQSSKP